MELLTDEIKQRFEEYPLYSQENKGINSTVIVKYFNPVGSGTWLITEAEKQEDGDWLLFGYCHLFEWEWGYVLLSEITSTLVPVFGCKLPLERDLYFSGTVNDALPASEKLSA